MSSNAYHLQSIMSVMHVKLSDTGNNSITRFDPRRNQTHWYQC